MMNLKPYTVSTKYPEEGALLVFATNRQEAKVVGWNGDPGIFEYFTDVRVRRMEETDHIMSQKQSDDPHCIDDPVSCPICGMWGKELCDGCDVD